MPKSDEVRVRRLGGFMSRISLIEGIEATATIPTVWWAVVFALRPGLYANYIEFYARFRPVGVVQAAVTILAIAQLVAITHVIPNRIARYVWMAAAFWWAFVAVLFALAPALNTGTGVYFAMAILSGCVYHRRGPRGAV